MGKMICPSMMCADLGELKKEVEELDYAGIDIFHIDIMDGNYVPNFGMGIQDLEIVRANTKKLVDVHLMVSNPSEHIKLFADKGVDIIYFHPEIDKHSIRTISEMKNAGVKVGIAINPDLPVSYFSELYELCDYVMVMTVSPGFAGQKFIESTMNKIKELVKLSNKYGFKLMVDGAISVEKINELHPIGVHGFILGTSALFGKDNSYKTIVENIKNHKEEIL